MTDQDRFARGKAVIEKLWGVLDERTPVNAPILDITIEHLFGDIWSRPGLALRDRSLITVAALTVLGREPQLRTHLKGALNAGISREEIEEVMIHLAHYGGWPVGMVGLGAARTVFDEHDSARPHETP